MPPHRVQSACSTVTALASSMARKYQAVYPYSPPRRPYPWGALAYLVQTFEMVRADRLFKPTHILLAEAMRQLDRLGECVGAVGVDEKVAIGANRQARRELAPGQDRGGSRSSS